MLVKVYTRDSCDRDRIENEEIEHEVDLLVRKGLRSMILPYGVPIVIVRKLLRRKNAKVGMWNRETGCDGPYSKLGTYLLSLA